MTELLAFIGVAIAVVVIPGPDMALVTRNVFRHGRAAGYATSIGICTGVLGWAIAAALGVATILAASSVGFTVLKLAGAAYLLYLGITTLRSGDDPIAAGSAGGRRPIGWHVAWGQGLVSSLLNPKLGVFFLTLLPQFIAPGEAPAVRAIQLALVFEVIGLIWLVLYTTMLAAIGGALGGSARRSIRWISGTVLVALGVRVAFERA